MNPTSFSWSQDYQEVVVGEEGGGSVFLLCPMNVKRTEHEHGIFIFFIFNFFQNSSFLVKALTRCLCYAAFIKCNDIFYVIVKYLDFLFKRTNTKPSHGPFHFRAPSRILWRTVRGINCRGYNDVKISIYYELKSVVCDISVARNSSCSLAP